MLKKTSNLRNKLWIYFIIFSVIILVVLWVFQTSSLDKFYAFSKKNELKHMSVEIKKAYNKDNFNTVLEKISLKSDACVQIYSNLAFSYTSSSSNRACKIQSEEMVEYMQKFVLSGKSIESYEMDSNIGKDKTILYGVKLDNDTYAFLSVSLHPLDSTVSTLKKQLLIVTVLILISGSLLAYYLSKTLSKPIEKMNDSAKKLASGNFDVEFNENTEVEEINDLAITLNKAKESIKKTDEIRQELMANVSHDLKTPLTMIKAYAEMVRDLTYKNKEKREDNLNTIISEADRLNLLVNDILDLTKLETKELVLDYEEFDLNEFLKEIVKTYDIYKEDGYTITYKKIKNAKVYADKKRIKQVVYNLINNAINYTGEDKKVDIKVIKIKDGYKVEVKDTGKGIDEKDINYIWDKYYKSDKTHSRLYLGSGIGLSIVKNILIKHNFNYGVNSIKNKGTTFFFEIKKK